MSSFQKEHSEQPWGALDGKQKALLMAFRSQDIAGQCDIQRAPSLRREVCLETALCDNERRFTPFPCPQEVQKLTEPVGTF